MRKSIVKEYNKELQDYFEALENTNPEVLEGLYVKGDFNGFVMELAMMGMRTLKRQWEGKK